MEEYESRHTGQVIDDAVDRAKAGGAIDKALSEKAPAGYGLGENFPNAISDCNNATRNGWYRTTDTTTNIPPNGPSGGGGALFVVTGQYNWTLIQYFFFGTQGYPGIVCQRKCVTSSWSDWEYVNPPMVIGQEYRTTERYEGKPVYVKAVDCGNLPNNSTAVINFHENNNRAAFSVHGIVGGDNTIPTTEWWGNKANKIGVQGVDNNIYITTTWDATAYKAVVIVKYRNLLD